MLLLTATLIAVAVILLFYCLNEIRLIIYRRWILRKLPGPPRTGLLIGNMLHLHTTTDRIFELLGEWREKYYPIYTLYAMHKASANILSPEDSELILSNPIHMAKGQIYNLLHTWLKSGLLTSTGDLWRKRRRMLTPAFHFSILQQFIGVFNEETHNLVETIRQDEHKSSLDVTKYVNQFTLKTIAETAMGTKLQFKTKREIEYKQAVYEITQLLLYRLINPWYLYQFINKFNPNYRQEMRVTKILHKFTKDVIEEREKNFESIELPTEEHDVYKGKKRLAMLDLLLNAKKVDKLIDDAGIREEVDTFMFEGHDTTAVSLGFTLMLLACNQHCQELILQEMQDVLEDIHKKPSYNDLQEMKYLDRCIKESLRLYPSVFFISRKLGEDLITHSGYLLPKDTITVLHIYQIHHNPDIYPDPEKFDPDRFLPQNSQNRHPYAYLPFSAGPRNCIGQKFAMLELKTAVSGILANFKLEPVDTPETTKLAVDIVLRTKDPIKVKFVPRN